MEEKLLRNILKDYNRKARPVLKESDVVHISMDIALPQLMKIVSKIIASYVLLIALFCIYNFFFSLWVMVIIIYFKVPRGVSECKRTRCFKSLVRD